MDGGPFRPGGGGTFSRPRRSSAGPQLLLLCSVVAFTHAGPGDVHAWLFAVPPLLLVWANVHGSFLLGLGILGLELVWSFVPALKGRLKCLARFRKSLPD